MLARAEPAAEKKKRGFQEEQSMIFFKVLLIAALVIPLVYVGAVMMNSILDEVLKNGKQKNREQTDTKQKKDRKK